MLFIGHHLWLVPQHFFSGKLDCIRFVQAALLGRPFLPVFLIHLFTGNAQAVEEVMWKLAC
jgi:hypothetical protein